MDDTELTSQNIIDTSLLDEDPAQQNRESAVILYPSIHHINKSFAESVKDEYFQKDEKQEEVGFFHKKLYEQEIEREIVEGEPEIDLNFNYNLYPNLNNQSSSILNTNVFKVHEKAIRRD